MREVAVFIDYQNCYRIVREQFHHGDEPSYIGNIRPSALAQLLAGKGTGAFKLVHVGVYCGLADPRKDPKRMEPGKGKSKPGRKREQQCLPDPCATHPTGRCGAAIGPVKRGWM